MIQILPSLEKLNYMNKEMRRDMFKVGRAIQWAFADGQGVNLKDDPETIGAI